MQRLEYDLDVGGASRGQIDAYYRSFMADHESIYSENGVYLDCGAGVGIFSLLCAKVLKARRVFAYDGYCRNFSLLLANRKNNSAGIVVPDDHHIAGESGRRFMTVSNGVVNSLGVGERYLVETRKVDDLTLPQVDFLKVTVPGSAVEIVEGASHTIQSYQPTIIIEVVSGKERVGVRRILSELGYGEPDHAPFSSLHDISAELLFFSRH